MVLKAAIFDLDGTLLDTEKFQWLGWNQVLKPFGISIPKKDYHKYVGKTGTIVDGELIDEYKLDVKKGALIAERRRHSSEMIKESMIKPMPYALQTVRFFSSRGIKTALASGSFKDELMIKLNKSGIYPQFFDIIVSRDDVSNGKPHPDTYLHVLEKLDARPDECIVFEDTQYGLEAAKSAGLPCVVVPNELSKSQDFSRAEGVFDNLKKAFDWVMESYGI